MEKTPADILAMPTVHDDFEVRLAQALFQVDELLQEQTPPLPVGAVRRLHAMQVLTQDLVILACSRHIKQTILRNRSFPPELLTRLQAAFTVTALADESLESRLGNSKHHVWTVDKHRKNHKHRPARSGRGNRRHLNASISDEDSSTATTETASAAPAGSSPAKFPRPPEILSSTAFPVLQERPPPLRLAQMLTKPAMEIPSCRIPSSTTRMRTAGASEHRIHLLP